MVLPRVSRQLCRCPFLPPNAVPKFSIVLAFLPYTLLSDSQPRPIRHLHIDDCLADAEQSIQELKRALIPQIHELPPVELTAPHPGSTKEQERVHARREEEHARQGMAKDQWLCAS